MYLSCILICIVGHTLIYHGFQIFIMSLLILSGILISQKMHTNDESLLFENNSIIGTDISNSLES